jgi:hypothetical protein
VLPHNKGRFFDALCSCCLDQELFLTAGLKDVSRSRQPPLCFVEKLASRGIDVAGMEERGVSAACTETKVIDVPMRLIQLIVRTAEIPTVACSPGVVFGRVGHLNRRYGN